MLALESGNLAEWVGAVGTVAAFSSAAIVWIYNLYATRRDAGRAQAALFDAWVIGAEIADPVDEDPHFRQIDYTVQISNGSYRAIRSIFLIFTLYRSSLPLLKTQGTSDVPPTSSAEPVVRQFSVRAPAVWLRDIRDRPVYRHDKVVEYDGIRPIIQIQDGWIDATGEAWTRLPNGKLKPGWDD